MQEKDLKLIIEPGACQFLDLVLIDSPLFIDYPLFIDSPLLINYPLLIDYPLLSLNSFRRAGFGRFAQLFEL